MKVALLQTAHTEHENEVGYLQQPTDKISKFQLGSKSKYYQNSSFGIELLYGSVCSTSLCKLTSCQEPGSRTKPSMPITTNVEDMYLLSGIIIIIIV